MRSLTFSGFLLQDGHFELEPGFVVDAEPRDEDGPIEVVALGYGGQPIATTRLGLQAPCAPPVAGAAAEPAARTATGVIAFPDGATGLQVRMGSEVLLDRPAPRRPTTFDVRWPASIERGPLVLVWDASMPDCRAALGYSADGGNTWTPLSLPSADPTITADTSTVAGGRDCLLELFVTDGFNSQRLRSEQYRLPPAAGSCGSTRREMRPS